MLKVKLKNSPQTLIVLPTKIYHRFKNPCDKNSVKLFMINNGTKRMFNDPNGIRCGRHTDKFLLQTYKRDTGEIMHDFSVPIFVQGEHWGDFRIGFKAS